MEKEKRMNIAFLAPGLGRIKRGVEAGTLVLAQGLSKDCDVTIFSTVAVNDLCQTCWAIRYDHPLLQFLYRSLPFVHTVVRKYFGYWPSEIQNITFSLSVFPKLLSGDFDVIFPVSIWGVCISRIVRKLRGTKFIYINHGGAENFIVKQKPDIFIAFTPDVETWARTTHPNVKTVLLPPGIDLSRFSDTVEPIALDLERPWFLCVAALIPYKRVDLTIKAISQLPHGSLIVLGQGVLQKELEDLGMALLGPKRFLLTSATHDQMSHYYATCDVFTMASERQESFAAVYLEAMAANLPVVAPQDERREFQIGEAGILCNVDNIDEYAQALQKASQTDFGDKIKNQAERFSIEKNAARYHQLIDELSAKKAKERRH